MFPIAGLTLEKFSLRTCQNAGTRYLLFFESLFMPFMKNLTLVSVFASWKESEGFLLLQRKVNVKMCPAFYSRLLHRQWVLEVARVAPPSSFPGNDTQHLSVQPPKLWTVFVSICALILMYFVHPLVRYLIRWLLFQSTAYQLTKGFMSICTFG